MDAHQDKVLLDKLMGVAAQVRGVIAEMDAGAQENLVADWLAGVDGLRERDAPVDELATLCIGIGAREHATMLCGAPALRVTFEGSWAELLARDPYTLGAALFHSELAVVAAGDLSTEDLEWLSAQLPVVVLTDPVPVAATSRPSTARTVAASGGNPQRLERDTNVIGPPVARRRAVHMGALIFHSLPIIDALRRNVNGALIEERIEAELRTRQSASAARERSAEIPAAMSRLRQEQTALQTYSTEVSAARIGVQRKLDSVRTCDQSWPRELGANPLVEIAVAVTDDMRSKLIERYGAIADRQMTSSQAQATMADQPSSLSHRMYVSMTKVTEAQKLTIAASDASVARIVDDAHSAIVDAVASVVGRRVMESVAPLDAQRVGGLKAQLPDFAALRASIEEGVDGGRARRACEVLSKPQHKEMSTATLFTALRWGYAAVRPHMFLIVAVCTLFFVTSSGVKRFINLGIGLALGVLVALVLYPGKARLERARSRSEFVDQNVEAILSGLRDITRNILVDFTERAAECVEEAFKAVEAEITDRSKAIAAEIEALAAEYKNLTSNDTAAQPRGFLGGRARAASASNVRDLERNARAALAEWTKQFKVTP